jgi:hypothetical protein
VPYGSRREHHRLRAVIVLAIAALTAGPAIRGVCGHGARRGARRQRAPRPAHGAGPRVRRTAALSGPRRAALSDMSANPLTQHESAALHQRWTVRHKDMTVTAKVIVRTSPRSVEGSASGWSPVASPDVGSGRGSDGARRSAAQQSAVVRKPRYGGCIAAERSTAQHCAPAWHAGGRGFEPPWLHSGNPCFGGGFFVPGSVRARLLPGRRSRGLRVVGPDQPQGRDDLPCRLADRVVQPIGTKKMLSVTVLSLS